MDYYDELGVPRDATPEEIRIAFRRKAKQLHPDREGGDAEAMTRANRAHDTLIDPARRLTYDRTGRDKEVPVDKAAQDVLQNNILAWIESDQTSGDMIADLTKHLNLEQHKAGGDIAKRTLALEKTEKRLAKLKFKGKGRDFVREALNHKIITMRQQIEQVRDRMAVTERAKAMLATYEYEVEPPATFVATFFNIPPASPFAP